MNCKNNSLFLVNTVKLLSLVKYSIDHLLIPNRTNNCIDKSTQGSLACKDSSQRSSMTGYQDQKEHLKNAFSPSSLHLK